MNVTRSLRHLSIALTVLPISSARLILREAWRIERALPHWFNTYALPELMQHLDDEANRQHITFDATNITYLADAAVGLDYFSPLGLCLRRSLVRYVLLRRAGVPVVVHFGAKKSAREGQHKIAGHAWLTLHGEPYAENPEDYHGFTAIYVYPSIATP